MPQGSKHQTYHSNVHKGLRQSQLSKTDTGTLERNNPTRTRSIGRPHMVRQYTAPNRMMLQGRKWQMGCPNMHKALGQSQLSKTDTGALERNGLTRLERARLGDLTWHDTTHPTERCHKGENEKRAARTCIRHAGGHNLAKLMCAPSNEMARPDLNAPNWATSHSATRRT